jgi:hypothetical protein
LIEVVNMFVGRLIPRDARLSAREVRTLRRLEDATVAEDPLLDVRLGLPLRRMHRVVVGVRRRSKAIGRQIAHEAIAALAIAGVLALAVVLFATHSLAIGSLILLPSAFVFGLAISRPPRLRATTATFERASHVGQPPRSHVE